MATVSSPQPTAWTAADLVERFGPIPLARVVFDPPPGAGTLADVVWLDAHENRLCELIDGVIVEKVMGARESFLAGQLITLLNMFLAKHKLGIALTSDGMMQLLPNQVRIPDASFISWARLEGSGWPEDAAPDMAPDLAVEVLSPSNTAKEMESKLHEYFAAGTRLVWYVEPRDKTVTVYTAADKSAKLTEQDTLTGGQVLPGLEIDLKALFALPKPPKT
jgi:Uma2 family endonuclease